MSTGRPSSLILGSALALLAAGAIAHAAGAPGPGDDIWMAAGAVGAADALWAMVSGLRAGRLGVDVIALLAVTGALAVGEYLASGVIGVMVTSGRFLEDWAEGRARRDLRALADRAPRSAHRYENGGLRTVEAGLVRPGDRLMVRSGELVPADGNLLSSAVLDESNLTGESRPVERASGEPVRSGVVNVSSPFDLAVTARASESAYASIVRLVSAAESSRAPFVRLADRYANWFLGLSLLAGGAAWMVAGAERAVAVLVVATPCPLILAAPIALVAGLSRAARRGVVIKGGGVLERLARCTTLLIDKTGTLTSGHPVLVDVVTAGSMDRDQVLGMAGSLDQVSAHVLAHAVVQAARERGMDLVIPSRVEEVPGRGIRGDVGGKQVSLGKANWVGLTGNPSWVRSARRRARLDGSITVFVSVDDQPAGVLLLEDPVRVDATRTIRSLRHSGISRIVMVTGDRAEVAESVGAAIGVDEVLADRAPEDKLDAVRLERRNAPTMMVGDGINDAPALALADVGVAMGSRGATASSEAADVVLTVDRIDRLGEARHIAHRSRVLAIQSVVAGMVMSLVAMGVAAMGFLPAVWGAFLQEGIDVAVILNALRSMAPAKSEIVLNSEDSLLTRRFRDEHVQIRESIDRVRSIADSLGDIGADEIRDRVREAYRLLSETVWPHEAAEQEILYPALERILGGSDPTGPMSRAHIEIAHQIRRLGRLIDEIGADAPDGQEVEEIRILLYGLYAILRLHTSQEDESYLSLADDTELLSAGSRE